MELSEAIPKIHRALIEHFPGKDPALMQTLALAEEAGEFVKAFRRWKGYARRIGTEEQTRAELADVIITAYVTAYVFDWDVNELIQASLAKSFSRPWNDRIEPALSVSKPELTTDRNICRVCGNPIKLAFRLNTGICTTICEKVDAREITLEQAKDYTAATRRNSATPMAASKGDAAATTGSPPAGTEEEA